MDPMPTENTNVPMITEAVPLTKPLMPTEIVSVSGITTSMLSTPTDPVFYLLILLTQETFVKSECPLRKMPMEKLPVVMESDVVLNIRLLILMEETVPVWITTKSQLMMTLNVKKFLKTPLSA